MYYRWYRSQELVPDSNSTKLVLENVSREANFEDITCEVENDVGSSRKITRLSVHCKLFLLPYIIYTISFFYY